MYVPFFVVISFMCAQASPLRHLTKSRLCMVLLEAPNNAQSYVILLALCVDASPLLIECVKLLACLSISVVVCKVKEAKNVKKLVSFQSNSVDRRDKLPSSCPVIS
jgi:hypothetical protein